jgi:signal peptidase
MAATRRTGLAGQAGRFLAWLVMLGLGALVVVAVLVPRIGGATPYVIETGSMRPQLPPGALVVVRPVDAADLRLGDVITYQVRSGDPTVVTHRIVAQGIDSTGKPRFRTQGDANDAVDRGWVQPAQIEGRRWYAVPVVGHVTTLVTAGQRDVLVPGVAGLLLGYAVVMVATDLRNRRRLRGEVTP